MTLQEKLQSKLQPHADRIKDGNNDEFDYLPAVLLHLIEEQKKQIQANTESFKQAKADIKNNTDEIARNLTAIAVDAKNSADEISRHLTAIAAENQKTRRLLFMGLAFGAVTLVIAILLYARL